MQLADLDITKVYSYADYLKWQFEERIELIKGKIFKMSPAPTSNHQIISSYLHYTLFDFLEGQNCMVFPAPFDVRLPVKTKEDKDITTVVQPDICVICDRTKIDEKGCVGAPDIIVEILSPSSSKKDLKNKYEVYEQSGVREYWIVFPNERTCLVYTLHDGTYTPSKLLVEGDYVHSTVLHGFSLDLANLFGRLI